MKNDLIGRYVTYVVQHDHDAYSFVGQILFVTEEGFFLKLNPEYIAEEEVIDGTCLLEKILHHEEIWHYDRSSSKRMNKRETVFVKFDLVWSIHERGVEVSKKVGIL